MHYDITHNFLKAQLSRGNLNSSLHEKKTPKPVEHHSSTLQIERRIVPYRLPSI